MKNKFLKPILALTLVASMVVGGSLAYITSQTEEINNQFVMAEENRPNKDVLEISIKETFSYTPYGEDEKDLSHCKEKIAEVLPGDKITKNPIISVDKLDINTLKKGAYIFAKITDENNLMTKLGFTVDTTNAWTAVPGYKGVYYILKTDGVTATTKLPPVFDVKTITVTDDFHTLPNSPQSIKVQGYAIQAQGTGNGIMSAVDAWKAFKIS